MLSYLFKFADQFYLAIHLYILLGIRAPLYMPKIDFFNHLNSELSTFALTAFIVLLTMLIINRFSNMRHFIRFSLSLCIIDLYCFVSLNLEYHYNQNNISSLLFIITYILNICTPVLFMLLLITNILPDNMKLFDERNTHTDANNAKDIPQDTDANKDDVKYKTKIMKNSHYCRICNLWSQGFDHHCYGLAMCFGRHNIFWFQSFILNTFCLTNVGIFVAYNYGLLLSINVAIANYDVLITLCTLSVLLFFLNIAYLYLNYMGITSYQIIKKFKMLKYDGIYNYLSIINNNFTIMDFIKTTRETDILSYNINMFNDACAYLYHSIKIRTVGK